MIQPCGCSLTALLPVPCCMLVCLLCFVSRLCRRTNPHFPILTAFLASRNKPSVDKQLFTQGMVGWRGRGGGRRRNVMNADRQVGGCVGVCPGGRE